MELLIFLLAFSTVITLGYLIWHMVEKNRVKKAEMAQQVYEKRNRQVTIERSIRRYIEFTEKYKNMELSPCLEFFPGEKLLFFKIINTFNPGYIEYFQSDRCFFIGAFILTDHRLIIINIDEIHSYKIEEIVSIGIFMEYLIVSLHDCEVFFNLPMKDLALVEKIAALMKLKIEKAGEYINPKPNPELDEDVKSDMYVEVALNQC